MIILESEDSRKHLVTRLCGRIIRLTNLVRLRLKQYPTFTNVNTPPTSTNPSAIVTSTQAQTSASNKENLNFNNKRKTSANSSPLFDTTRKQQRLQFQCQTTTPQHKQTTLNFASATQGLKTQYDNPTTTIDDLHNLNPEFFDEN